MTSTIHHIINYMAALPQLASPKHNFPVDPMHQFEIYPIKEILWQGLNLSFTNSSLWMLIAVATASLTMIAGATRLKLVPGRWQMLCESTYLFIANMLEQNAGPKGKKYFPFIFTLFMFILSCNLLGMIPGSFTVTSHIIITFALAAIVFLGVTLIGFIHHGASFLRLFVPKGVPIILLPLLIVIETISYLTRPISLSVRLFANLMAGHTMLKVFAGFVILMGAGGIAPLLFMTLFSSLEILIAFLQAYVFAVLTCIYLNDALNMNH